MSLENSIPPRVSVADAGRHAGETVEIAGWLYNSGYTIGAITGNILRHKGGSVNDQKCQQGKDLTHRWKLVRKYNGYVTENLLKKFIIYWQGYIYKQKATLRQGWLRGNLNSFCAPRHKFPSFQTHTKEEHMYIPSKIIPVYRV